MKKLIVLIPIILAGCVGQPLTPIGKAIVGVAEANTSSKANVTLHIVTPQGTLDYSRTITP